MLFYDHYIFHLPLTIGSKIENAFGLEIARIGSSWFRGYTAVIRSNFEF